MSCAITGAPHLAAYNEQMDRLNAIRLLQALVAAGANCYAPMADAWIKKVALEIALAYAGTQDWLVDNQKEGSTSLTSGGEAWASPLSTTKTKLGRRRTAHAR